ncbi:PaaI family thioesterase [Patulibacter sp. NPDC049589]|uniref:PaaI family thioesterase n=1 Tax=Patulibacter sp. NPDC049589 TaxID=3154731 RepID=UPI0034405E76
MSVRTELPPPAPLSPSGPELDGPIAPHTATCFGCGPENPASLGLRFVRDGDVVRADITLESRHEGAPGLAHGGIVAAILDDMSGAIPRVLEQRAVTAKLDVDFGAPVVIGRPLVAESWLESFEGRKIRIAARVRDGDEVVAASRALFLTVPREHFLPRDTDGGAASIAP